MPERVPKVCETGESGTRSCRDEIAASDDKKHAEPEHLSAGVPLQTPERRRKYPPLCATDVALVIAAELHRTGQSVH